MNLGGAFECQFPQKVKGGKRTLQNNGTWSLPAGNEKRGWSEGGLPLEDVRMAMMNAWNHDGEDSGSVSPLSCGSTTAPGTPPTASPGTPPSGLLGAPPGLLGTPPDLDGTAPGLFTLPGLTPKIEEKMASMMQELALKTQSLHATEMRARVAEQKWLDLQLQVMLNNMNMKDEVSAARRSMQQLQGCGMPPNIGCPQPGAKLWEASGLTGREAQPIAMTPKQGMPLPVGLVMPEAAEARAPKPARSKKKAMAFQNRAESAGAGTGFLSRGSKNHALSRCRPCQFYFSTQGCPDGLLCNFCHYPHSQAKLLESAMYSAKAAEKRGSHKKLPKTLHAKVEAEAMPPAAHAVPLCRFGMFNDVDSMTSTTPPESESGEVLWSVTVGL